MKHHDIIYYTVHPIVGRLYWAYSDKSPSFTLTPIREFATRFANQNAVKYLLEDYLKEKPRRERPFRYSLASLAAELRCPIDDFSQWLRKAEWSTES